MRRTATIVLIVLLGTLAQAASAQIQRYPYGCVEDLALRMMPGDPTPLRCTTSNFSFAHFDSLANFRSAHFDSLANRCCKAMAAKEEQGITTPTNRHLSAPCGI